MKALYAEEFNGTVLVVPHNITMWGKTMKGLSYLFGFAALCAVGAVNAAEPAPPVGSAAAGKALTATCAACHGAAGVGVSPDFPNLAGQSEVYLNKQLDDFKSGARKNVIMNAMVAALTTQNVRDIAAYYASLPAAAPSVTPAADPKTLALGARIYNDGLAGVTACVRCHAAGGVGQLGHFPRLAGQHAKYLAAQLEAFKKGVRGNDAGKMMVHVAAGMNAQDMQAVAQYLQSL